MGSQSVMVQGGSETVFIAEDHEGLRQLAEETLGNMGYRTIVAGEDTPLAVTATGAWPLTYQWKFNGAYLPGVTNSFLLLTNVWPVMEFKVCPWAFLDWV